MKKIVMLNLLFFINFAITNGFAKQSSIDSEVEPQGEYLPHTAILPEYITEGDTVIMGLAGLYEYCLALDGTEFGVDYYYQIDNDSNITVVVRAVIIEPCPGGGSITDLTHFYSLGELPAGEYHAQMWMQHFASPFPPDPNNFTGILGSNIAFTVHALPQPVPLLESFMLIFLVVIILAFALVKFKVSTQS